MCPWEVNFADLDFSFADFDFGHVDYPFKWYNPFFLSVKFITLSDLKELQPWPPSLSVLVDFDEPFGGIYPADSLDPSAKW